MLGMREPEIYGHDTLNDIEVLCRETADKFGYQIDFRQSNHEGEIIDWIQQARGRVDAIGINAAGYTHTSVAIHDALKLSDWPVAEIHLSEPKEREDFRHHSTIEAVAKIHVSGKGKDSYRIAIEELHGILS